MVGVDEEVLCELVESEGTIGCFMVRVAWLSSSCMLHCSACFRYAGVYSA